MNNKPSPNSTILVATYNKADTIKMCIDSLLALDSKPERILVLDGGSTDGTYEILKKYNEKIDLKRFPKTGLSWRINWALDNVKTKYTIMTDADCVVDPNWLNELILTFETGKKGEKIVATAGYCGTPKNVSFLQNLIGYEMDNRFNRMPKYIYRAPTMSLCLKTEIAKKVKFDETQMVAVETDFGFRLSKYGKIIYTKKAKVWHYHRNAFIEYFKQLKNQAKWAFRLIFRHNTRAISDPITSLSMTAQIPLFFLGFLFLFLSYFYDILFYPAIVLLSILLLIYLKNILEIKPPLCLYPVFIPFFLYRTLAWVVGVISGSLIAVKFLFSDNRKI
ncbi:glycosyltransferase family 2 protein [Candidatus Parcubacteria bacterium]|nr:glycosyltransferase family 2 protein [Candidatus Parcubacteria bacterium]